MVSPNVSIIMLYETVGQEVVWLRMACFGMAGSIWYVLCAGLRRVLRAGTWLSLAADFVCAFGLGGMFCAGLIRTLSGEFRLYALTAFCIGFGLFAYGINPVMLCIFRRIYHILIKIQECLSENHLIKALFR